MGIMKYIIALILSVSLLFGQDTVYIASVGNNATVTYKSTVQSIPLSSISASKFTGVLQPTRVAIFNGATQINDWVFNNYKFKVNSTAITNVDSFVPVVNRLNTASIKSFKLVQDIRIVTALPATPDPTVTYIVGAQDAVNITGLNGDADEMYKIDGLVITPASSNAISMRFNNISSGVYDMQRVENGSGGAYANQITNTQTSLFFAIASGGNSLLQFNMSIDAKTGKNRTGNIVASRSGSNQIAGSSIFQTFILWRDNSTNLTSINLRFNTITGGYGVGTEIKVYTLRP